jgi:hypothetical protein
LYSGACLAGLTQRRAASTRQTSARALFDRIVAKTDYICYDIEL